MKTIAFNMQFYSENGKIMIIGKMATYPKREKELRQAVMSVLPQVDKLIICLNEYKTIPAWLTGEKRIESIIPKRDLKDLGKFITVDHDYSYCVYFDDDILYPPDYVETIITGLNNSATSSVVSFHGSIYSPPVFSFNPKKLKAYLGFRLKLSNPEWYRRVYPFHQKLETKKWVEQVGTGVLALRKEHEPPLKYMENSIKFVDVRFSKWCFENKIKMVCLERPANWIREQSVTESIASSFTPNAPRNVQKEIYTYAGKSGRSSSK